MAWDALYRKASCCFPGESGRKGCSTSRSRHIRHARICSWRLPRHRLSISMEMGSVYTTMDIVILTRIIRDRSGDGLGNRVHVACAVLRRYKPRRDCKRCRRHGRQWVGKPCRSWSASRLRRRWWHCGGGCLRCCTACYRSQVP